MSNDSVRTVINMLKPFFTPVRAKTMLLFYARLALASACMLCLLGANVAHAACTLVWDASLRQDGQPINPNEVVYRVWVKDSSVPDWPAVPAVTVAETSVNCEAAGWVNGQEVAISAVWVPSGEESPRTPSIVRVILTTSANLHVEDQ